MSAALDHIIAPARDKWASARFLAHVLGVDAGPQWGPFVPVRTANGVALDYMDAAGFDSRHCAFLVSDADFDAAFARIQAAGIAYFADPSGAGRGQINHRYGGRGVYFRDPDGHLLELITRTYGATPEQWNPDSEHAAKF